VNKNAAWTFLLVAYAFSVVQEDRIFVLASMAFWQTVVICEYLKEKQ